MVICRECESEFKIISHQHLKYKHSMSVNEYILKYPGCNMGYFEMCETQKITVFNKYGVENVSYLNEIKEKIIKKNTGKRHSIDSKIKMSKSHKGKILTEQHKKNIGLSGRITIEDIKKKYLLFSRIEELRYNPERLKDREIQVHCKNHNCKNSKEKGGWFTVGKWQLSDRIRALESENGNEASYFYCSEQCKSGCILYNRRTDYLLKEENKINSSEYNLFRKHVLYRDNYICQFCGDKATDVHHERPKKLEPFFALDPDYAWSCCKECHYEKGHKDECNLRKLADTICLEQNNKRVICQ